MPPPQICGPYGVCTKPSNRACPSNSDGSFPSTFPSDNSRGCSPTHDITCLDGTDPQNQHQHQFLSLEGVDYFSNKYSSPLAFSTQDACKDACLQNCSCLAAFWHEHSASCFHVAHMSSLQGSLNSSYMASLKVERIPEARSADRRGLIIGLVSGGAGLLLLCLLAILCVRRKMRKNTESEDDEQDPFWQSLPGLPTRYSFKDLQSITNGFSEQLGKGGFGTVYAGVLQDGTKVAVKRLESFRQGAKEFKAEVLILGGIHHYNLASLVVFFTQGSHLLINGFSQHKVHCRGSRDTT